MSVYHAENFGTHYARTLHEWRARYRRQLDRVRALGFSERFIRMWDLYFAFCEAAFLERHAGVFQFVLNKNYQVPRTSTSRGCRNWSSHRPSRNLAPIAHRPWRPSPIA